MVCDDVMWKAWPPMNSEAEGLRALPGLEAYPSPAGNVHANSVSCNLVEQNRMLLT